MKKILLVLMVMVSTVNLFAWGGDFAISCNYNKINNIWPTPDKISSLNGAWRFGGSGDDAAGNSTNKILTLKCVSSPTNAGEIGAGDFYFRIIHLSNLPETPDWWYSWGGKDGADEYLQLNNVAKITGGNAYNASKAAYFTASVGKTYQILFQKIPNNPGESNITILEFDSQTNPKILSVSESIGESEITITLNAEADPGDDQKFWVKYYFNGQTADNAQFSGSVMSGTNTSVNIPINYGSFTTMYYYTFTTEAAISPSVANENAITLWRKDNSGGYYESGVLPVELSSFTASIQNKAVVLNWATATEINNYGFEVERSFDKTNWNKVAFKNGYGNSNSVKDYTFTDKDITKNGTYYYRLKQIDNNGDFEYSNIVEVNVNIPVKFEVAQNYPNPFNPVTNISFNLPEASNVTLYIFNAIGQQIKTINAGYKEAGKHTIEFDGSSLNSGVYFYKVEAGNNSMIRKMALIK